MRIRIILFFLMISAIAFSKDASAAVYTCEAKHLYYWKDNMFKPVEMPKQKPLSFDDTTHVLDGVGEFSIIQPIGDKNNYRDLIAQRIVNTDKGVILNILQIRPWEANQGLIFTLYMEESIMTGDCIQK